MCTNFFPPTSYHTQTRETILSGCNGLVSGISKSSTTCTGNSDWKPGRAPQCSTQDMATCPRVESGYEMVTWNEQWEHSTPSKRHMTPFLVNRGLQPDSGCFHFLVILGRKLMQCWIQFNIDTISWVPTMNQTLVLAVLRIQSWGKQSLTSGSPTDQKEKKNMDKQHCMRQVPKQLHIKCRWKRKQFYHNEEKR